MNYLEYNRGNVIIYGWGYIDYARCKYVYTSGPFAKTVKNEHTKAD